MTPTTLTTPTAAKLVGRSASPSEALCPSPRIRVVRGHTAVLQLLPLLVDLSHRCHQPGTMEFLPYFLTVPYFGSKIPTLLLFSSDDTLSPTHIQGAVLFFEYRRFGIPTRVFVTDDPAGERSVIAPPDLRPTFAVQACDLLISRGAHLVFLSVAEVGLATDTAFHAPRPGSPAHPPVSLWTTSERVLTRSLPLEPTFEATLSRLGAHTRRNLRYYRRRARSELGAVFVPTVQISEPDFRALNQQSAYPVPDHVVHWRFRSVYETPGALFAGVHAADGRWLSLIGGRRYADTTAIDWQINQNGLEPFSLSTVMRSYLLEHEIARGARQLVFEGGTPHSMRHSFLQSRVTDLVVARQSRSAHLVRRLAPALLPEKNLLAAMLRDKHQQVQQLRHWHPR